MKRRKGVRMLWCIMLILSLAVQSVVPAVTARAAEEDDIYLEDYYDFQEDADYSEDFDYVEDDTEYSEEELYSEEDYENAALKESREQAMTDEEAQACLMENLQAEEADIADFANSPDGKKIYSKAWIRVNDRPGEVTTFNDAFDSAISGAMSGTSSAKIVVFWDMTAKWPIVIDGNNLRAPVELYLQGNSLWGNDDDGVNYKASKPFFILKNGATLNIYGGKLGSLQACKNIAQKGTKSVLGSHYFKTGRLVGSYNSGNGGAIYCNSGTTLNLYDLTIANCASTSHGGAIYADSQVAINMVGSKITCCYAENNGGAIYLNGSGCNVSLDNNTEINENYAKGHGGAFFTDSDKINIYANGANMNKNFAGKSGGAIYFNGAKNTLVNAIIKTNIAQSCGGAIFFDKSKCSATNVTLIGNKAYEGGAIYDNGKENSVSDATITNNKALKNDSTGVGGGIFVSSTDDIGISGHMIIKDNSSTALANDNLYLNKVMKATAMMEVGSLNPRSEIYLRFDKLYNDRRLTVTPGNHDPRLFKMDQGGQEGWYVYFDDSSRDQDDKDKFRHLLLERGNGEGTNYARIVSIDFAKNKTTSSPSDYTYKAQDGKEYEVVYGYASSPSHTEDKKDILNKYFWSDGYFMDDPKTYNVHLATMGMNIAMASADSNVNSHADYRYKFDNIKSLLRGIGCDEKNIYINDWYIKKPTDDSIGVAIAKKTIKSKADNKEYTLVPIAIRSYGYEKEWASNMTLNGGNTTGMDDESSGFKSARTHVMEEISFFIKNYGLEEDLKAGRVKFFLTGFSRGSATANLTGKYLVDTYGIYSEEYKNNPNQVYAYCYAVPAGGTDAMDKSLVSDNKEGYYCIHNIINKVDLTPMVAPEKMGFKRYGVDHYVPGDAQASEVKKSVSKASDANSGYSITTFSDNNAWFVSSSDYAKQRSKMLSHLFNVNDTIKFNDHFNEYYVTMGVMTYIAHGSGYNFVKVDRDKSQSLETWLPKFYDTLQTYNVLTRDTALTRYSYSNTKVQAGGNAWSQNSVSAQDTFRNLVMLLLSKTPTEKEALSSALGGMMFKLGTLEMKSLFSDLIDDKQGFDKGKTVMDSLEVQDKWLNKLWSKLTDNSHGQKSIADKSVMSASELSNFKQTFPALMGIVFRLIRDDYNKNGDKAYILGTFGKNTDAILQGHVPEIALAWLRSYDNYYEKEDCAYKFTGSTSTPRNVRASLKNASDRDSLKGDQTVILECEDAEIYYTIKRGSAPESQLMLYHPGLGIKLSAPKTGSCDYSITAYALKGYPEYNGAVSVCYGPENTYRYTLAPAQSAVNALAEDDQHENTLDEDAILVEEVASVVAEEESDIAVFAEEEADSLKVVDAENPEEEAEETAQSDEKAEFAEVAPVGDNADVNPLLRDFYLEDAELSIFDENNQLIADRSFANFIKPNLPKTLGVLTDDDAISYLPVEWESLEDDEYDPNYKGYQEIDILGRMYVPDDWGVTLDYIKENGERAAFTGTDVVITVYVNGEEDTAVMPYSSVESGRYFKQVDLTLDCDTENAQIWYTLDGTSPIDDSGNISANAIKYEPIVEETTTVINPADGKEETVTAYHSGVIQLTQDTTLMSVAIADGMLPSNVQIDEFVILDKPEPILDESVWEDLEELYLTDGQKLSDIQLPEGFKWNTQYCDIDVVNNLEDFEDYEYYEMYKDDETYDFYVPGSLIYNPDSEEYSDLEIDIDIPIYPTQMDIVTENCYSYDVDGEEIFNAAEGETVILVPELEVDFDNQDKQFRFDRWEVKDANGAEISLDTLDKYEIPEEIIELHGLNKNISCFKMPAGSVTAKAIFTEGSEGFYYDGEDEKLTYTGSAQKLSNLRVFWGDSLLVEGTDYVLTYSNNVNAGTAKVNLKGKGDYSEAFDKDIEFVIEKVDLGSSAITAEDVTVLTTEKVKDTVVKWNGKTIALKGNFTVEYSDSSVKTGQTASAGTYTATIKPASASGNFTGLREYKVFVVDKSAQIPATKLDLVLDSAALKTPITVAERDGEGKKVKLTVKYKNASIASTDAEFDNIFETRWLNNKAAGTAYVYVTVKDVEKAKAKFGAALVGSSKVKSFTVAGTKLNANAFASIKNKTIPYKANAYTFSSAADIETTFGVTKFADPYVFGTDYTVSVNNAVKQGKMALTFTGAGIYTGKAVVNVKISKFTDYEISFDGFAANGGSQVEYKAGGTVVKGLVVRANGFILREFTDFTVSYEKNKDAVGSTGYLKINGKNNYGAAKIPFKVVANPLSKDSVYVLGKDVKTKADADKALAKNAAPRVFDLTTGKELKKNVDFTWEYISDYDANNSMYAVKIKGKGNYASDSEQVFDYAINVTNNQKIKTGNGGVNIVNADDAYIYTGMPITPDSADEFTGAELGTDFEIIGYKNNIKAGTATVKIKGIGNWGGTCDVKFKINKVK